MRLTDRFWTCTGYHLRDGQWEWSQWFTYDRKTHPCPEHGDALLVDAVSTARDALAALSPTNPSGAQEE